MGFGRSALATLMGLPSGVASALGAGPAGMLPRAARPFDDMYQAGRRVKMRLQSGEVVEVSPGEAQHLEARGARRVQPYQAIPQG